MVRLFALQIASTGKFTALAEQNRTATEAIPSTRGVIYDRNGQPLVANVPGYTVKVRPADLPDDRRVEIVARLAALLGMPSADINVAIDSNPGLVSTWFEIASDVDPNVANFISESGSTCRASRSSSSRAASTRPGRCCPRSSDTPDSINAEQLLALKPDGYLPDDQIGKTGVEAGIRDGAAGHLRGRERRAGCVRAAGPDPRRVKRAGCRQFAVADDRRPRAGDGAQQALSWGMDSPASSAASSSS